MKKREGRMRKRLSDYMIMWIWRVWLILNKIARTLVKMQFGLIDLSYIMFFSFFERIINIYSLSPNGLWINSLVGYWLNCFSKK